MMNPSTPSISSINSISCSFADALRQQLRYHQQLGICCYPSSDSLRKFLTLQPEFTAEILPQNNKEVLPQLEVAEKNMVKSAKTRQKSVADFPHLQERLCWRLEEGEAPLRLLLVGDKVRGEGRLFFGRQEDEMVKKMMTALGLPGSQVGIINVITDDDTEEKITPKLVTQYGRRLFLQVAALAPECICAMGSMAAKALLQTSKPLSLLRGRFHHCPPEEYQCPVLVTYHPFFLLHNSEMKKPTWIDLQFLGHHMGLL